MILLIVLMDAAENVAERVVDNAAPHLIVIGRGHQAVAGIAEGAVAVRLGMQRVRVGGEAVMLVVMVTMQGILRIGALGVMSIEVRVLRKIGGMIVQIVVTSAIVMWTLRGTTP